MWMMSTARKKECQHPLLVMTNVIYSRKTFLGGGEGIISGLCKAAGKRESLSPGISHTAPQQLRSPLGQTCLELFISQPSGSAKFSNQKSIWFVPLKLHFLVKKNKTQKTQLTWQSVLFYHYTSLELKTAWNTLKWMKPVDFVSLCSAAQGLQMPLGQ